MRVISKNFNDFCPSWLRDFKVYFQHFSVVGPAFGTLGALRKILDPCEPALEKSQGFEHLCSRIRVSAESNQEAVAELLKMVAPTRMHKYRNATTHVCFEFIHTEVVGCIFDFFCCGWLKLKLFKPVQLENIGMLANLRYTLGSMGPGIFTATFAIKINPTCRYIIYKSSRDLWIMIL